MSILIEGIDMPRDCCECRFCTRKELSQCILSGGVTNWEYYNGTRRVDCPLVPVPTPHGRLVDADELKATFCAECNHTITCEDCDLDYHIGRLAPTIIEAEEGEEA